MQIKKHKNKNDYCLSKSGHWVRDFTKPIIKPFDINQMNTLEDMNLFLDNEFKNSLKSYSGIDSEEFRHDNILIIGDGFRLEDSLSLIDQLPQKYNNHCSKWGVCKME